MWNGADLWRVAQQPILTANNQETVGNTGGNIVPYDGNGNIQYLQRTDVNGAVSDQFSYQYGNGNNQLMSVTNVASGQPYANYSYDAKGRLYTQSVTGSNTTYMTYDVSGLVTGVYQDAQYSKPVVTFAYNESGMRVKKVDYNTTTLQPIQVTFYVGDVIYTQQIQNGTYEPVTATEYQIIGAGRLGIYSPQGPTYAYELTDHQGSVRAVVTQNANALQVTGYSDYYPFGKVLSGTPGEYGYQGQNAEFDPETGWNSFDLRMYDSRIGRWISPDPYGQFYSPYLAMGNVPFAGTDMNGADWYQDMNGYTFWANASDLMIISNGVVYNNIGTTYSDLNGSGDEDGHFKFYVEPDPDHVSTYHPTYWQKMERGNFFQSLYYDITNSFYVTAQNLGGKQIHDRTYALNLDGSMTTPNQNVGALATSTSFFIPGADAEAAVASTGTNVAEKGVAKVAQVTANKAAGDAFRDEIADLMQQAGRDVQTEVYHWTPLGQDTSM